ASTASLRRARIQHKAGALTRAGGATSPEGRGRMREMSRLLEPAQLLVHADLAVLMRVAVARLRAHAQLPWPVVEAEIGAALPLRVGQEASEGHPTPDPAKDPEFLCR